MKGRSKLLGRCFAGPCIPVRAGRLLLAASLFVFTLVVVPPADAQARRIAISELTYSLGGPDRNREYIEIANLGETAWNPNNHWILRVAEEDDEPQLFVRIQGVDPVPPNAVLLVEWGRPLEEGDITTACTTQGNVFCTGRTGANDAQFSTDELRPVMAIAVYAPTANNEPPDIAAGTMLAYYFQGDDAESIDRDFFAYNKAVQSNLWKDGDFVPTTDTSERGQALRMGPGAYPADHGRKAADYYSTLSGFPSLDARGFDTTTPPTPAPNTMNRAGTPGRPNYLHPGLPIPNQITAAFRSVRAQAVAASLAQNAPPAGLQVVALNPDGVVATSLFANNAWSEWVPIAGTPAADGVTLLNNPQRATRTLIVRAKADGALSMLVAAGDRAAFGAATAMEARAQFAPAAVVDPATGNEHYIAVEAGTGNILHNVNEQGKLRGWRPIAGITTNAPVAAAWSTDPARLGVLAWNGNQLMLTQMGADDNFGTWQNVGTAVSNRPAGIGPILVWNSQAKRLEVLALAGAAQKADVQHARVEVAAIGEAKVGELTRVAGVGTNAKPAVGIRVDNGQIRMLVRGGGPEPGPNPRNEPGDPRSGFVFELTFDGTAWSAPQRVGTGRLPGATAAEPFFAAPAPPETLFDPNTQRFHDFLIGEDAQLYHNVVAP